MSALHPDGSVERDEAQVTLETTTRQQREIIRLQNELIKANACIAIVRHGMPRIPSGDVIVHWEHDDEGEQYATIELMLPEHEARRLMEAM